MNKMNLTAPASVIQGYFPSGKSPGDFIQARPAMAQPHRRDFVPRRPPTYEELTLQAHQRSSGLALQRMGNSSVFQVPPHLATFGRRPGQKLPSTVRQKMESFFGTDFSDVQVYTGPEAGAIGALAFTQGANIYFAPGQYNPDSHFGQQLLGHELTHVVQQRAGRVRNPFGSGVAVVQDPALESEAERMGRQAAMHVTQPKMVQPKMVQQKTAQPAILQRETPVHVSGPMKVRDGSYRITAAEKGRSVGSVMVHERNPSTIEVTDLGVDAPQRGKGFGQKLLGSALRAGMRMGKSRVRLGVDDNGSGRLAKWYRQMGFRQTGVDRSGRPRMEAPISRIRSGIVQGKMPDPSRKTWAPFMQLRPNGIWSRTIQRAAKSKQQLEEEYNDAMEAQDYDRADQLDEEMGKLPGDTAQTLGTSDEDGCDLSYKNKQIRFTWDAGARTALIKAQTDKSGLHCGLGANCYMVPKNGNDIIALNAKGKEEWMSKGGNKHETAPPIDHYSPDWKDRLKALMKRNYDVQKFTLQGQALYNAKPLRIIHMVCNSKRNGSS
jgi:ribosomal protein S18 acetylase RimI-like enzyme